MTEPFEVRFEEKIIRVLECVSGTIEYEMICCPRFDYGTILPRCTLDNTSNIHGLAHGGANALLVYSSSPMSIRDASFVARGQLRAGEKSILGLRQPGSLHDGFREQRRLGKPGSH